MSKVVQLVNEYVELCYRFKRYLVRRSELENKRNKILMLPDGNESIGETDFSAKRKGSALGRRTSERIAYRDIP